MSVLPFGGWDNFAKYPVPLPVMPFPVLNDHFNGGSLSTLGKFVNVADATGDGGDDGLGGVYEDDHDDGLGGGNS